MLFMNILLPFIAWPYQLFKVRMNIASLDLLIINPVFQSGATIDRTSWTLWAASDPRDDNQVAKIDAAAFYQYIIGVDFFSEISGWKNMAQAVAYLNIHGNKAGAGQVVWTKVLAKLSAQQLTGISVKRMRCLQSLVYWIIRNTGSGTIVSEFFQQRFISFILANKETFMEILRNFEEKRLIRYLTSLSDKVRCRYLNWPAIVDFLIRKRGLFECTRDSFHNRS